MSAGQSGPKREVLCPWASVIPVLPVDVCRLRAIFVTVLALDIGEMLAETRLIKHGLLNEAKNGYSQWR